MNETPTSNRSWLREYAYIKWIGFIVLAIVCIGIGFYVWNFGTKSKLSDDTQTWGAFADYLSLFVNIINSVAVIALTLVLHQASIKREGEIQVLQDRQDLENKNHQIQRENENREYQNIRERENRAFQASLVQPIIIFKVVSEIREVEGYEIIEASKALRFYWKAMNAGRGPAINIRIKADSGKVVKCYTMKPDEEINLPWVRPAYIISASYKDVLGQSYTSTCIGDETTVEVGDKMENIPDADVIRYEDALLNGAY